MLVLGPSIAAVDFKFMKMLSHVLKYGVPHITTPKKQKPTGETLIIKLVRKVRRATA